jgi:hypothetical protein
MVKKANRAAAEIRAFSENILERALIALLEARAENIYY